MSCPTSASGLIYCVIKNKGGIPQTGLQTCKKVAQT